MHRTRSQVYPSWNGLSSELPLVAEFCVRNGYAEQFVQYLGAGNTLPGHVVLLRHLEEMIALNFTVFSEEHYDQLSLNIQRFRTTAERWREELMKAGTGEVTWPEIGKLSVRSLGDEIIAAAESIGDQCRKAKYLYLKAELEEGLNLEVNQDKAAVETYLHGFGFSKPLANCLEEAERLYIGPSTDFQLKSSMGHLRSFIENLHIEAIPRISSKGIGGQTPTWGTGLALLREDGFLSEKEEKLAAALYGLMSDEGVHPLIAGRECTLGLHETW